MMKRCVKISIDLAMFILLLLLMEYHLLPRDLHEWFGISLFILFIVHNILNYKWYKVLFNGKYGIVRITQTAIIFLLWVVMIGCIVSSVPISGTIFTWMNISGAVFGRNLHMISTSWAFLLMNLHLGYIGIFL